MDNGGLKFRGVVSISAIMVLLGFATSSLITRGAQEQKLSDLQDKVNVISQTMDNRTTTLAEINVKLGIMQTQLMNLSEQVKEMKDEQKRQSRR